MVNWRMVMPERTLSMKLRICVAVALSLSLSFSYALAADENASHIIPGDEELIAAIDRIAERTLAQPGGVGLSVAVARGDDILLEKGYGIAEAEHDVPVSEKTMFRIGSVTKQYTAAAIMRLSEQGKLALDDELSKYLPEFPTQGHVVTIRHLLNHTSGIVSYTNLGLEWMKVWPLELTHEQMLDLFKDKPFEFSPGEKWAYNNSGYYLLGMIIERVLGKSYAEYLDEAFFKPLGLERTRYDSNAELIRHRAQGYRFENGKLANDRLIGMSQPGAAGGLIATAGDMVRWQQALTTGRVVSEESFAHMTTPCTLANGEKTSYGFGLVMDTFEGHQRVHHSGGIFGFNSTLVWFPQQQLHIAVISNSEMISTGKVVEAIARVALGVPVAEIQDITPSAAEIKRFVGEYVLEKLNLHVRIFEHDGRLKAQATGQPIITMLYQGNGEFRADFDTDVKIIFPPADKNAADDADQAPAASFVLHQNGAVVTARRVQ